jgi:hypothetical protein
MTLHVDFTRSRRTKYGCTDYSFFDRHTSEEIAFGSYNEVGDFEILGPMTAGVEQYVSAAVAFTALNRKLEISYGF